MPQLLITGPQSWAGPGGGPVPAQIQAAPCSVETPPFRRMVRENYLRSRAMKHRIVRGRLGLIGAAAAAFAVVAAVVTAEASAAGVSTVATQSSTVPAWTGAFDNFH